MITACAKPALLALNLRLAQGILAEVCIAGHDGIYACGHDFRQLPLSDSTCTPANRFSLQLFRGLLLYVAELGNAGKV